MTVSMGTKIVVGSDGLTAIFVINKKKLIWKEES